MAERPIFIPAPDAPGFVIERSFTISWAGGFAVVQKKKNIHALHKAAEASGFGPILEASTKSDEKLGQRLSAFNLKVRTDEGELPLECAYQGSKVFERGGPYIDLFHAEPKMAKRDPRLQSSGKLIAFSFAGHRFPLEPKTVFYDWLYITAIFPHRNFLFRAERLPRYAGFTDIEFNPSKSINCQARSCALFVSLRKRHLLEEAVQSPEAFIAIVSRKKYLANPKTSSVEPPQTCAAANADIESGVDGRVAGVDAAPQLETQNNSNFTVPAFAAPLGANLEKEAETAEVRAQDDRPRLQEDQRPVPPSNFELFLKEKAARDGKRQSPTRSRRGTKRTKRDHEAGKLMT